MWCIRLKWRWAFSRLNGVISQKTEFLITTGVGTSKPTIPAIFVSLLYFVQFTFSFIHSSMALQPFFGPWLILQLRNIFYTVGRTPWTGDQPVARPLPTHRTTQTQIKSTHRYPCLEWDWNPRSQLSSEDSPWLRPRSHRDRSFTFYIVLYTA
jgi:hypothetical protein